ncbi:MAG: SpoIIE family protein phosphatase [Chloroflexota bacterium]|nr:SpoIIE family protein phosphatase [Chloroflexota bacterium]
MAALRYGIANRPKKGEEVSGDAYVITEAESAVTIGLVDGLGSGEAALEASQLAIRRITLNSTEDLKELVTRCHEELRGTRGAVMALLRINLKSKKVSFVGVGNIGLYAWSAESIMPISHPGVVGSHRLPNLREFTYRYTPGDLFVLYSDGVSDRLIMEDDLPDLGRIDPQAAADIIAERYGKEHDDITVIVVC